MKESLVATLNLRREADADPDLLKNAVTEGLAAMFQLLREAAAADPGDAFIRMSANILQAILFVKARKPEFLNLLGGADDWAQDVLLKQGVESAKKEAAVDFWAAQPDPQVKIPGRTAVSYFLGGLPLAPPRHLAAKILLKDVALLKDLAWTNEGIREHLDARIPILWGLRTSRLDSQAALLLNKGIPTRGISVDAPSFKEIESWRQEPPEDTDKLIRAAVRRAGIPDVQARSMLNFLDHQRGRRKR